MSLFFFFFQDEVVEDVEMSMPGNPRITGHCGVINTDKLNV